MKRTLFILAVLLLGLGSEANAQEARNGTSAAPQMLIPIDARTLGGGGAVATATGLESVLWNPAGLDSDAAGDVQVMLSRRNYLADIGVNFAAIGLRFGNLGALGVSLRSYNLGDIEQTDEFNMDGTGESFSPTFFTLGTTYSRAMTDRIRIGATANLIYESFANVSANGVALDAGVQYSQFLGVDGLGIGVAIRNIGTAMRYDGSPLYVDGQVTGADRAPTKYKLEAADADMPTVVDLGVSYMPINGLSLGVTYMENTYGPSEVRSLAAYDFYGYITVRGAYTFAVNEQEELDAIFNKPAFGATLNLQPVVGANVMLDYGFMPVEYFDATHAFTIRAGF